MKCSRTWPINFTILYKLENKKVAILATDGSEKSEVFEPMQALRDERLRYISFLTKKVKSRVGTRGQTRASTCLDFLSPRSPLSDQNFEYKLRIRLNQLLISYSTYKESKLNIFEKDSRR